MQQKNPTIFSCRRTLAPLTLPRSDHVVHATRRNASCAVAMGALRGTLGHSVCSAMLCAVALTLAVTLAAAHETFVEPQGRMLIFNGE